MGQKIDKIEQKLMQIKKDSSTGYILEVDLEYPKKFHDIHNDYPLAPEKKSYKKMYKYKELFDLSNFPVNSKYY